MPCDFRRRLSEQNAQVVLGHRGLALDLGERHRRRSDLRLELTHVELGDHAARIPLPREVERRPTRRQRSLSDRALLVELEQLQVPGGDVADQREQDGALGGILSRRVGVRRLVPAPEHHPKIHHPRHVARKARRAIPEYLGTERRLVGCSRCR